VKRGWSSAGVLVGLALNIAGLVMLAVSVWAAVVPEHYESPGEIGTVCDAATGFCFEVDDEALDQAFEDDLNRSNRIVGSLGATTSCAALIVGWRMWRRPWRQGGQAAHRARTVVAAAGLSPIAAVPIFVTAGALYRVGEWLFDIDPLR
jgi:hypothetical protein